MRPAGRLGLEAAGGIRVVGAAGGGGGGGGDGAVAAVVVMAEVEVGQRHEGGATTSRSTTTLARRSWGASDGRSCLRLGAGAGAGACVDASRCPSWHSVVIWSVGCGGQRAGGESCEEESGGWHKKTVARESLKGLGFEQMQCSSTRGPGRG